MRLQSFIAAYCLCLSVAALAQAVEPSVLVETVEVISKQVSQTINAYGAIEPDPDALTVVALPRAGLVTRLHVRLGERVAAGDPLLELDTAPGTRMLYAQAVAARDYAEGQLRRTEQLFAEQLATREQIAAAEHALGDAVAQLNALKDVGANQNRQTIRAVTDGIVTGLSISTGDRVAADTPALFLARAAGLVVRLGIEPEDARRIPENATLELVSIFQNDVRIQTQIEKVSAMINPSTRLVDAIAPIPESAVGQLTLGSMMQADIQLTAQDALVVPRSVVLRDQDGAYVFVVERNHARRVNVTVVYESATETGIQAELMAGDTVVRTGNYVLSDGALVRTSASGG
jgi:RND family efflux transporter MFP subunit